MKLGTKAVTVRLPEDEYVFLRTTAAADGKSMGGWVEELASKELKRRAELVVTNGSESLEIAQRIANSRRATKTKNATTSNN